MDGTVDLADAFDPQRSGRKAAALAELIAAGFPVPAGVVIPPGEAYDPEAIWARLDGGTVAVRSSGRSEDGTEASHAGMFETVLGVVDPAGLPEAIEAVRRSAESTRAAAYGTPNEPMAVLVQHQVDAVASGVAFTADPVSGDRAVVLIGAVQGLGEALVDGSEEGDAWRLVGDRVIPLRRRIPELDEVGVRQLATLARRVEASRGSPQDIEWAWDGSTWWLLQARPMTALPSPPPPGRPSLRQWFSRRRT